MPNESANEEMRQRRELARVLLLAIETYRSTGVRGTGLEDLVKRVGDSAEEAITQWLGDAFVPSSSATELHGIKHR